MPEHLAHAPSVGSGLELPGPHNGGCVELALADLSVTKWIPVGCSERELDGFVSLGNFRCASSGQGVAILVEVYKLDGIRGTSLLASCLGFAILCSPFFAKVAFGCDCIVAGGVGLLVRTGNNRNHSEWTNHGTQFAADTALLVDGNGPLPLCLTQRASRAHFRTGRIFAMAALHGHIDVIHPHHMGAADSIFHRFYIEHGCRGTVRHGTGKFTTVASEAFLRVHINDLVWCF